MLRAAVMRLAKQGRIQPHSIIDLQPDRLRSCVEQLPVIFLLPQHLPQVVQRLAQVAPGAPVRQLRPQQAGQLVAAVGSAVFHR